MNVLISRLLGGYARNLQALAAGWLVAKGWEHDTANTVVGAIVALGAFAWTSKDKIDTSSSVTTPKKPESDSTSTKVDIVQVRRDQLDELVRQRDQYALQLEAALHNQRLAQVSTSTPAPNPALPQQSHIVAPTTIRGAEQPKPEGYPK